MIAFCILKCDKDHLGMTCQVIVVQYSVTQITICEILLDCWNSTEKVFVVVQGNDYIVIIEWLRIDHIRSVRLGSVFLFS